jgi:hypothetical protein
MTVLRIAQIRENQGEVGSDTFKKNVNTYHNKAGKIMETPSRGILRR